MPALRTIRLTAGATPLAKDGLVRSYPFFDGKQYLMPLYPLRVTGSTDGGVPEARLFEILRFGVRRVNQSSRSAIAGVRRQQTHVIRRWLPSYKVHSYPSVEDGAWQVLGNLLIHDGPDDPAAEAYGTLGCLEICGSPRGFVTFNDYLIGLSGSKKPTRATQLAEIGASGIMSITYVATKPPPLVAL